MNINDILKFARENECSDIHITAGTDVALRRFGHLKYLKEVPTIQEAESMIMSFLSDEEKAAVLSGHDIDVGYMLEDKSRIRINVYHQRNNIAASIRLLYRSVPDFKELGLPPIVKKFADLPRGLVLVTGPTGCGKSTTLASILDYINHHYDKHILTIEDPIEYIFQHDKAMIHQREVGRDTDSFKSALRSALREDPDIILVGEMRDFETISAAITAAETGHLVLSTLHTTSAAQTVERIIDGCPADSQNQLRLQLANILEGVITQQLLPRQDDKGRIIATETLLVNYAVKSLIRDNKIHMITDTIQSNGKVGMHTLNSDLVRLYNDNLITKESAFKFSSNPKELSSLI